MKMLEPVLRPETSTYIDDRFGKHPRLAWWTECVPRLSAWLIGKKLLYRDGEVREYGITGIQIWPTWFGLIWALWHDGPALWPWLVFLILLFAAMTRDLAAGVAAAFVAFGVAAAAFYAGQAAVGHLGYAEEWGAAFGVCSAVGALALVYRSIARFEPAEIPNYNGEPVGRRV